MHRTKSRPFELASPLASLRGVGPARAASLERLALRTVRDLLLFAPRRYEVWEAPRAIGSVRAGEEVTVRGRVTRVRLHSIGRRRSLLRVRIEDETGEIEALFFNQPYLRERFREGEIVGLHGRAREKKGLTLPAPRVESEANPFPADGGIVPIYPECAGTGQTLLRSLLAQALPLAGGIREEVSADRLLSLGLPPLPDALRVLHAPPSLEAAEAARRRLAYDELLGLQRRFARARARARVAKAPPIAVDEALDRRIRAKFAFTLTPGQERAIAEMRADLASGSPMRRLLQGDVGCGKTAVALYACLAAIGRGRQAAFLAPTEILAEQHRSVLRERLRGSRVRIECLTASLPAAARRACLFAIADGSAHLVVGTHALLVGGVKFRSLALAVIDEQHRFGVEQRKHLLEKGEGVHALALTATPIPRTLAMALFGDLDVSTIEDLPPGRGRRVTRLASDRRAVVEEIRSRLLAGEKGFWVCPRIEAKDGEEDPGASAAEAAYRSFAARELRGVPIGLLHGRLPVKDREAAVAKFRTGEIRLLVCTSVIEVGVDVPEATAIVIEGAERFGLAALHQLRGRVGRGGADSVCILLAGGEGRDRLRVLVETEDGFRIAEEDLRQRGPGEVFGRRQSGFAAFRIADPERDLDLLEVARSDALALSGAGAGAILDRPRAAASRPQGTALAGKT